MDPNKEIDAAIEANICTSQKSLEQGEIDAVAIDIDPKASAKVCWKFDTRLLPLLSVMYLFNSMDRSNLGNAKTDGLDTDLHLVGNQYSNTLVIFYITFCLFDLPLNLLLKKLSGKIMLPTLMLGWGSMTMLQCAVHNWGGLLACRLLMGLFEAGFMGGVVFYLTQFYRRNELALRIALFYGAATIAGAFSGLLAFGVFQINDKSVKGWMYLFIIEGGASVLIALFAYWHLPKNAETCKWLSEEEKAVAKQRILLDGSVETNEKFDIKVALRVLFTPRIAIWTLLGFSYGVASASVGNFLPQMVQRLGYAKVKTNLYTVAPYCVGTVILLCVCRSSDYHRERSLHLCFCMMLTFIGYIILATVDVVHDRAVAYFACFLLCAGAFAPSCLFHSWHQNNTPHENQRAAVAGFLNGAANSGGIISSLSFTAKSAPLYMPALIVTATFQAVGMLIAFSFGMYLRYDNKRRNKLQGVRHFAKDVVSSSLVGGTIDPNWRWTP